MLTHERLDRAVRETAASYLADRDAYPTVESINCGSCQGFAGDVMRTFGNWETVRDLGITAHGVSDFMAVLEGDEFVEAGNPFDRALIGEYWPTVRPPEPLDWDDMDRLSADASFDGGTHIFLHFGGRFYDAECPVGSESFFELPFFRRVIAGWLEDLSPSTPPSGTPRAAAPAN